MSAVTPPYREGSPIACGRCGVPLQVRTADVAADGYRCLSCSTDESLAAAAHERWRDARRIASLRRLRLTVYCVPLLALLSFYSAGSWRVATLLLLVPVGYFAFIAAREVLRS